MDAGPVRRTLKLKNTHPTEALTLTIGASSAPFTVVDGWGTVTLAPRAVHEVVIEFDPAITGKASGELPLMSSDPARRELEVGLTGKGLKARPS